MSGDAPKKPGSGFFRRNRTLGEGSGGDGPKGEGSGEQPGEGKPSGSNGAGNGGPGNGHDPDPTPEFSGFGPTPPDNEDERGGSQRGERNVNIRVLSARLGQLKSWRCAARFNLFSSSYEVLKSFPPPAHPQRMGENGLVEHDLPRDYRPFDDPFDLVEMTAFCQEELSLGKTNKGTAWDVLRRIAKRNAYHPVHEYFAALPEWDNTSRCERLFLDYFHAVLPAAGAARDNHLAYVKDVGRCFLIGAVARIIRPGCKCDHVPVAVSTEGLFKSTAIRSLCADEAWFTDNISPNLIERDTKESLLGKWLIELAEMPHIAREAERVKAFFSSQVDRYRPAYALATKDFPRQCVFFGTSNKLELLDTTGNRRIWPIRCHGEINVAKILADRDQLWAEALKLYRADTPWWLDHNVETIARTIQAEHIAPHVWDKLITDWIDNPSDTQPPSTPPFSLETVMLAITTHRRIGIGDWSMNDQRVLGDRLRHLGFEKRQTRRPEGNRMLWHRNVDHVDHP
jgi:hypothetical protein